MNMYNDGSMHDKRRMNVEGDGLSNLPDDLIHKILSFTGIKQVVQTSILSSRWRFTWKAMPYLNFSTDDFTTLPQFSKFVTHVLSRRNNVVDVFSLKLHFVGDVSQEFVKRIMEYAFSHNIQQLNVTCLLENDVEFPVSLFSSQTLKHLSLTKDIKHQEFYSKRLYFLTGTSTCELPALTTLYLNGITFCCEVDNTNNCIGFFSKCTNLKSLTLISCNTKGLNCFSICHPRLSNLTLEKVHWSLKDVNVVVPKLENLIIRDCNMKHVISAANLASLVYKGYDPLQLSTDGFHYLKEANICVYSSYDANARIIVRMLQKLHNVKFLKLSLEIVEVLSSSSKLILHRPSPFTNLKSLKIYPHNEYQISVAMSTEAKRYLLDGSPSATFTMVSREEIITQKLMAELWVLKQEKANIETNNALSLFISKMKHIEGLLTKLRASKRGNIQPCFSSMYAEAEIVRSKVT